MEPSIYSIYDIKTKTYNRPFFEISDTVALRNLKMEVNRSDQGNMLYMFPEDYELYRIGKYNQDTGKLTACEPELIGTAASLQNPILVEKSEAARKTAGLTA